MVGDQQQAARARSGRRRTTRPGPCTPPSGRAPATASCQRATASATGARPRAAATSTRVTQAAASTAPAGGTSSAQRPVAVADQAGHGAAAWRSSTRLQGGGQRVGRSAGRGLQHASTWWKPSIGPPSSRSHSTIGVGRHLAHAGAVVLDRRGRRSGGRGAAERGHRAVAEHVAGREHQPGLAGQADQPHRHDAVAAEVEEAVVDADARQAEHPGEQGGAGRLAWRRGARPRRPARRSPARAARPVELAVGGERQRVERRRPRPAPCSRAAGRPRAPARPRRARARPSAPAGPAPRRPTSRVTPGASVRAATVTWPDGRVAGQRRLDLARLDAVAPHLDLVVGPADEARSCRRRRRRTDVAGAVHAGAGRPERVGHEPLGGQAGPAEVAAGQLAAAQVQLAGDARQHRRQAGVRARRRRVLSTGRPMTGRSLSRTRPTTVSTVHSVGP